ncbi:hypothetical protein Tco_0261244 [Tanacetum coccineum]
MFIKYSSSQIPPKKSRGKGSQGKKIADNIIPNPDVALELGKSISLAEAEEAEAARQVHATHARIVTESVPESAKKKTSSRSLKSKLKGVQSLNPTEKEATDIMQALKESKKTSKRQTGTRGSSEGTGTIPGFPDESTVVSVTPRQGRNARRNKTGIITTHWFQQ